MAGSTIGQLIGFGSPANYLNASTGGKTSGGGCRLFGSPLMNITGSKAIYGITNDNGSPAARTVVLMRQDTPNAVVGIYQTTIPGSGIFQFLKLAAGNYVAIDFCPDNSEQALIYDWVVAGP